MVTNTSVAITSFKERVEKEEQFRRSYYVARYPDGPGGEQRDPYDNDRVPALHSMHRTMVTPVTLSLEARSRTPVAQEASAHDQLQSSPSAPRTAKHLQNAPPPPTEMKPPPCTSQTRSASALELRAHAGGAELQRAMQPLPLARTTPSTRTSGASRRTAASVHSQVQEVVQREVARTQLGDYLALVQANKDRERDKRFAMPLHLRTGPSVIDMGHPPNHLTESQRAATLPIQMAADPKWSTELKRINEKVGQRIEYERRLSASVSGSMLPELRFMYPKKYVSNPPTPFFKPGQRPH